MYRDAVPSRDLHGQFAGILPNDVPGGRVMRRVPLVRVANVHDPVVHGRLDLHSRGAGTGRRERPRPSQPNLAHVVPGDLIERAVPPVGVPAAPHEPVGRVGVVQHRLGQGAEGSLCRVLGGRPHRGTCDKREQEANQGFTSRASATHRFSTEGIGHQRTPGSRPSSTSQSGPVGASRSPSHGQNHEMARLGSSLLRRVARRSMRCQMVKTLSLFERQSDGSWKMVYDCFNSSAPP